MIPSGKGTGSWCLFLWVSVRAPLPCADREAPHFCRGGGSGAVWRGKERTKKGLIKIDTGKRVIDWNAIRAEYIGGGISQRKLADKHGIPVDILLKKANREHWKDDREKASNKAATRAQQKTAEVAADNAVIAANIKRKGLLLIERIMDGYIHDATEHRENNKGVTDVKRLRDMTAAYKDLTEDLPKAETDKNAPVYELLRRLDDECRV